MKSRRFQLLCAVWVAFLYLATMPASAQYNLAPAYIFVTNHGAITITGYTGSAITGPAGSLNIPDSTNGYPITGISSNAFVYCNPTSVTIPASITNIGEGAFAECTSLTNISVDAGNPGYVGVGGVLFNQSMTVLMQYPTGLAAAGYVIPGGITRIGAHAFDGYGSLTSVTIPNSVTSIGEGAFFSCYGLTNAVIPDEVTNIGNFAFFQTGLGNVTVPNGVTSIGKEVFAACSSLTNVLLGNATTSIGIAAFSGCASLTSVTIPGSVTNLDAWAFENCTSLTNVYFFGNAPTADSSAFSGDDSATAYYLPGTTGWGSFDDIPTALWLPQVQPANHPWSSTNTFGLNINWAGGQKVVIEASTDLVNWTPVGTNTLAGSSTAFYDSLWTNFPNRFYRVGTP